MSFNSTKKDLLAQLLAMENITVLHKKVSTASFHPKNRVLTLPVWEFGEEEKDADKIHDLLIGHEVGHALFTPEDGWHDAICDRGTVFKHFLNVIEDARIERKIQSKYPGLRRSFTLGYRALMARGFFGISEENYPTLSLLDRINVFFKCGITSGVKFSSDEKPWIKEIENAETWEDVVDIAERLFASEKEKMQDLINEMKNDEDLDLDEDDTLDDDDSEGDDFENEPLDWELNDNENSSENSDADDEDDENSSENSDADDENSSEGNLPIYADADDEDDESLAESMMDSKTDEALRSNMDEFNYSAGGEVYNITIPTSNAILKNIIPYKVILKKTDTELAQVQNPYYTGSMSDGGDILYDAFMKENKKAISFMVKEFEMKKRADEYSRTFESKTGLLDSVKMNNYKLTDDIFKKSQITKDGKNHGMIMYLDWSGSMDKNLKNTIDQVLNLAMFCRNVGIPFRVYAFTDRIYSFAEDYPCWDDHGINTQKQNEIQYRPFYLMELFSEKMNKAAFTKMAKTLLAVGAYYAYRYAKEDQVPEGFAMDYDIPGIFNLSGTPLDSTITAAFHVHDAFLAETRVDIVNTVFLTDGASHDQYFCHGANMQNLSSWFVCAKGNICKLLDTKTKTSLRFGQLNDKYISVTDALLRLYRESTGSNVIGFFIHSKNKRYWLREFGDLIDGNKWGFTPLSKSLYKGYLKDGYCSLPHFGYDKFFVIRDAALRVSTTDLQGVDPGLSKGRLKTAFVKAQGGRKLSRAMLTELMDVIS